MGVYDNIMFKCPTCGKEIVAQSKSGNCVLANYSFTSVPVSVAYDANRHAPFVCDCGSSWIFGNLPDSEDVNISLSLIPKQA